MDIYRITHYGPALTCDAELLGVSLQPSGVPGEVWAALGPGYRDLPASLVRLGRVSLILHTDRDFEVAQKAFSSEKRPTQTYSYSVSAHPHEHATVRGRALYLGLTFRTESDWRILIEDPLGYLSRQVFFELIGWVFEGIPVSGPVLSQPSPPKSLTLDFPLVVGTRSKTAGWNTFNLGDWRKGKKDRWFVWSYFSKESEDPAKGKE